MNSILNGVQDVLLLNTVIVTQVFPLTFYVEIILDSQEVAKIVQRSPSYPVCAFPERQHLI